MAAVFPALTTVFKAPTACASHWTWTSANGAATTTLWHDFASGGATPAVSSCYPHPSGTWAQDRNVGTYSPGICPSGQTTAGLWWDAITTTAVCCSSGYTFTGEDVGCTKTFSDTTTTITVEATQDDSPTTTTYTTQMAIKRGEAVQFAVAVMYEEDDLTLFPSDAQPARFAQPMTVTQTTSTSETSPASSSDSSSDSSSLPAGSIAAIAVGAAFAIAIPIAIIFFLLYRRRHHQRPAQEQLPSKSNSRHFPVAREMSSSRQARHEMDAGAAPRAELDAGKSSRSDVVMGYSAAEVSPSPCTSPRSQQIEADREMMEQLEKEERRLAERKAELLAKSAGRPTTR